MLLIRADGNKTIKSCLKMTCTHFNEITCTNHFTSVPLQSVHVLNSQFFSQDIFLVDLFTSLLSFMLLWMNILNNYTRQKSKCLSPYCLQDINTLKADLPQNWIYFFYLFFNQGNLPKRTLSTLSMQQANLCTMEEHF